MSNNAPAASAAQNSSPNTPYCYYCADCAPITTTNSSPSRRQSTSFLPLYSFTLHARCSPVCWTVTSYASSSLPIARQHRPLLRVTSSRACVLTVSGSSTPLHLLQILKHFVLHFHTTPHPIPASYCLAGLVDFNLLQTVRGFYHLFANGQQERCKQQCHRPHEGLSCPQCLRLEAMDGQVSTTTASYRAMMEISHP